MLICSVVAEHAAILISMKIVLTCFRIFHSEGWRVFLDRAPEWICIEHIFHFLALLDDPRDRPPGQNVILEHMRGQVGQRGVLPPIAMALIIMMACIAASWWLTSGETWRAPIFIVFLKKKGVNILISRNSYKCGLTVHWQGCFARS